MIFGGIRKTSLIDYPGKVSCVLFTSGCNFHCPFCHNPELASGKTSSALMREDELFGFLQERKAFLDGLVISGGEPTLHDTLPEFCRSVKAMGLLVKIDTNGSRPRILETVLSEKLVDFVAMDIKTDPFRYAPELSTEPHASDILESIRLIMNTSIPYEFRTTCVRPFVDDAVMERISALIQGARHYALQRFVRSTLLNPGFFGQADPGFDDAGMNRLKDIAAPRVQSCLIR